MNRSRGPACSADLGPIKAGGSRGKAILRSWSSIEWHEERSGSVITSQDVLKVGSWEVQDAKACFSEFLEVREGPQVVTRRGVETAVLVPIEEWPAQASIRPSLKQLLLSPEPRFENLIFLHPLVPKADAY